MIDKLNLQQAIVLQLEALQKSQSFKIIISNNLIIIKQFLKKQHQNNNNKKIKIEARVNRH
jgi:hypothetical protein